MVPRRFLYSDLDSFYCCCEILRDRQLRAIPFAVGGSPQHRGVVASASYVARARGVRSAMPMSQAVRICPDLRVITPHFADYQQRSQSVMDYLRTISPAFEQRSIDEAVLEITDVPEVSDVLARTIQQAIRERFLLPCSLGIASTIRVSKIAVDYGKVHGPQGRVPQAITIVSAGQEHHFLANIPVGMMPGIGPKMTQSLLASQIATLGDLAAWPMHEVQRHFGGYGLLVQRAAQGIDSDGIETSRQRKAISQEHTFSRDVTDATELYTMMQRQAIKVSQELQAKGLYARVVKLKLRWEDFTTLTRQMTLLMPTDQPHFLFQAAQRLCEQTWDTERPVRLIGVGVHSLQETRQLQLWELNEALSSSLPADGSLLA